MPCRDKMDSIDGRNFVEQREKQIQREVNQLNAHSAYLMNAIGNADPKYAKHIMLKNELVMQFAMHIGGGINILEQPVCRTCEGVAAWDMPDAKGNLTAFCFGCNVKTVNPVTIKDYLLDQVKDMPEEMIEALVKAGKEVDIDVSSEQD